MATNQTSIGGISAVNPQAKTDFKGYIDASYDALKSRLDPIFQQQNSAYQQSMVDRGIPVGGQAYNSSWDQMGKTQNDAYTQAASDSIGLGAALQGQEFGQDATRSQLANALLQQKWGTDLGYYNTDQNTALGYHNTNTNAALGYAGLNEQGRQFDNQLGYNYAGLGEQARQYDSTLDYNYWGDQNQQDFMWDRAASDDYRYAQGQDRQDYYDQRDSSQYDNALIMALLGMNAPQTPYTQDPTGGYNAQLGSWNQQYGSNMDFLSNLFGG